jgi:hypothetical protein
MIFRGLVQSVRAFFVRSFVQYGAGADLLRPLTKTKWWSTASWVLIFVGVIGWAVFIFWND